jgi:signal transduction histidine kinase
VAERLELTVLGELLGLLAHDLRNPLSALHSNLDFLRTRVPEGDADALEAVDDGLVSCDGIAHILDNVDLLAQELRGVPRADGPPVDLGALVLDVVASSRAMAGSHGVELATTPASPGLFFAFGSRDLLSRALANLLRNSIQHAAAGTTISVSVRLMPQEVVVQVHDTGVPLPSAVRSSAFTAAGQIASKSVPNGRYGRGLGLYCASLAALSAHASVRAVELPPGTGNLFELVVPRRA